MKKYLLLLFVFIISLTAQSTNPESTLTQQFDQTIQNWEDKYKTVIETDDQDRITSEITYEKINGIWVETEKQTYSYDDDGYMTYNELQIKVNGQWVNSTQYSMEKNEQGKKLREIWKDWTDGAWVNSRQLTQYYEGEFVDYREHQSWNGEEWENSLKETFTRDDDGHELERQVWVPEDTGYALSTRTVSEYSPGWTLTSETIEIWSGANWTPFQRLLWTVNPSEHVTEYLESFWDINAGVYIPNQRAYYTFDEWNRVVTTQYDTYVATNTPGNLPKQSGLEESWVPAWKITNTYAEVTSIEDPKLSRDFHLANNYPNPFNPSTNISFTLPVSSKVMLTVHSITGETVSVMINDYLSSGSYTKSFNAANLASGIYFYKLQTNDFVEVKKMTLIK